MSVLRLTALLALLGWAMCPLAFPSDGQAIDDDRVVGGFYGVCGPPVVACPTCMASPLACHFEYDIWGSTIGCACASAGSAHGCLGGPKNSCNWSCWWWSSCGASSCGIRDMHNCPIAFGGTCGACRCTNVPGTTCPDKC